MKTNWLVIPATLVVLSGIYLAGRASTGRGNLQGPFSGNRHEDRPAGTPSRAARSRVVATRLSPEAELEGILALPGRFERSRALSRFFGSLAPRDFKAAIDRVRGGKIDGDAGLVYHMAYLAWGKHDPLAALSDNRRHGDARYQGRGIDYGIAKEWATRDPEAALAFLATDSELRSNEGILTGVITAVAETDVLRAGRTISELDDKIQWTILLPAKGVFRRALVTAGPEAMEKWLSRFDGAEARNEETGKIVSSLKDTQYEIASKLPGFTPDGRDEFLQRWFEYQPEAFLECLSRTKDPMMLEVSKRTKAQTLEWRKARGL